ncbi:unnamed protein product [Enterobius vermicularis]|uniref:CX domain-containing protein n=1 Tax=Enterobius vermicularis TaxID=51028 RepID=A0A0N4VGR5_ENTVE|nr:unnamed protein product [Enterobius vermicularis]
MLIELNIWWILLFLVYSTKYIDAVIDYGEKAGKIRDEQFQIQFEQDYILNNKLVENPRRTLQNFEPLASSMSQSGPIMHGGRPAVPTDPNSPRDHKQPLSNYTKEDSVAPYYYPPRERFPLPQCFHNPTGYVCCSTRLNELMVDTYTTLEANPKFHICNIGAVAHTMQTKSTLFFFFFAA